jgi:NADH:ubiquinone oxidoreductase subunit 2 (subunit N)
LNGPNPLAGGRLQVLPAQFIRLRFSDLWDGAALAPLDPQLQVINACLHGVGWSRRRSALLYVGIGLMVVGFAFKISVVPFHMWTPDVHEGAPTPVTAFMSVTTKAAVFAAFVRVFNFSRDRSSRTGSASSGARYRHHDRGQRAGLVQTNMKRLLAYSGIAHAGYILVAMAANNASGITAIAFTSWRTPS